MPLSEESADQQARHKETRLEELRRLALRVDRQKEWLEFYSQPQWLEFRAWLDSRVKKYRADVLDPACSQFTIMRAQMAAAILSEIDDRVGRSSSQLKGLKTQLGKVSEAVEREQEDERRNRREREFRSGTG